MNYRMVADLHPAYVWDCDNCGSENFVRSIVPVHGRPIMMIPFLDETGLVHLSEGWIDLQPKFAGRSRVLNSLCGHGQFVDREIGWRTMGAVHEIAGEPLEPNCPKCLSMRRGEAV